MKMRGEILSSVGAQDLDTSCYQLSDLDYIEFNWKNSQLDAVFRQALDSPFFPTTFDGLSMEGSVENPILLNEEKDKGNPLPSTPEPVRTTQTPRLKKSRAFGARMENILDYVFRILFQ